MVHLKVIQIIFPYLLFLKRRVERQGDKTMEKPNRIGGKKVREVRRKPHRAEIMPFSKLKREMELTSREIARFLTIFRRIVKEVNDLLEEALDNSDVKESPTEMEYKKVDGKEGVYEWERKNGG